MIHENVVFLVTTILAAATSITVPLGGDVLTWDASYLDNFGSVIVDSGVLYLSDIELNIDEATARSILDLEADGRVVLQSFETESNWSFGSYKVDNRLESFVGKGREIFKVGTSKADALLCDFPDGLISPQTKYILHTNPIECGWETVADAEGHPGYARDLELDFGEADQLINSQLREDLIRRLSNRIKISETNYLYKLKDLYYFVGEGELLIFKLVSINNPEDFFQVIVNAQHKFIVLPKSAKLPLFKLLAKVNVFL